MEFYKVLYRHLLICTAFHSALETSTHTHIPQLPYTLLIPCHRNISLCACITVTEFNTEQVHKILAKNMTEIPGNGSILGVLHGLHNMCVYVFIRTPKPHLIFRVSSILKMETLFQDWKGKWVYFRITLPLKSTKLRKVGFFFSSHGKASIINHWELHWWR